VADDRDERARGSRPEATGRPSGFRPEIGAGLIELTIIEGVSIKHAARRLGVGVDLDL
jgi:hypothetical protein